MYKTTVNKIVILGISLFSAMAQADTILGIYAGVGQWPSQVSGDVGASNTNVDTLGFDTEDNNLYYLALEHPVPLLPNVLLQYTDLSSTGEAVLGSTVQFDNLIFPVSELLATDIDLHHTDATLYYEVLDNWLNVDLGVTLRSYQGELTATSTSQTESVDLDALLPMIYASGRVDLPLTGFSLSADVNLITYSGDSISDLAAAIAWNSDALGIVDVGLELGYRRMALDLDDLGDVQAKFTIDGPYLAFNVHF